MEPAVRISNLSIRYERSLALKNVCLEVDAGDFLGIIGPNGGGKSTLLKSVMGLIPPFLGSVSIFGMSPYAGRHLIGYVPQSSGIDRSFPISVREVVMSAFLKGGIHPLFSFSKSHRDEAERLLANVWLDGYGDRHISDLSGGEFQRLLFARALARRPRILLLDEPTASVDPGAKEHIYDLLAKLNETMTVVLVSHDIMAISSHVNKLACLNQTLVYHGEPELTENVVNRLYGCPIDLIAHGIPYRVLRGHPCS